MRNYAPSAHEPPVYGTDRAISPFDFFRQRIEADREQRRGHGWTSEWEREK